MICNHVRKGIVTNQTGPYDPNEPHASSQVCGRTECIVTTGRWVSGITGQAAYFRSDADRKWIPVDEVQA